MKPNFDQTKKILAALILGMVLAYVIITTAPIDSSVGKAVAILKYSQEKNSVQQKFGNERVPVKSDDYYR